MLIDNCVVCHRYLKSIGEQEIGMCVECDDATSEIAKDIIAQEILETKTNKLYRLFTYNLLSVFSTHLRKRNYKDITVIILVLCLK